MKDPPLLLCQPLPLHWCGDVHPNTPNAREMATATKESETPAVRAGQRDSERIQIELPAESAFEEPLEYRSSQANC